MSSPNIPDSALPPAWTEVVERIQQSLDQALAQIAERTGAMGESSPPSPERSAEWETSLAQVDGHSRKLADCIRQAEERTAETEALIRTSAEKADRWLKGVAECRRRLAEWATR